MADDTEIAATAWKCTAAYCRGGHEPGDLHDIPPCLKTCEWIEVGVRRKHDPACPNAGWRRPMSESGSAASLTTENLRPPEWCPNGDDGQHCGHWWDDTGPCCRCGDDTDAGLSDASPGRKAGERG